MKDVANRIIIFLSSNKFYLPILLALITLAFSIYHYCLPLHEIWGGYFTRYNNYLIFKSSFGHLINNANLYVYHTEEYFDLFKYSPTFAILMAPFYYLPDWIGLSLWNLLGVFTLYAGINNFKEINANMKLFFFGFVLFELITNIQNAQSNLLLVGLAILSFNMLEKGKGTMATFFIVLGTFIKIYSVLGCLILLFYPNRIELIVKTIFWAILFLFIPLVLIDYSQLILQYQNWWELLKQDEARSMGMSAYTFAALLLPYSLIKPVTLLIGLIFLFVPFIKTKYFRNFLFRRTYFSLLLIWIVVFNHMAESPTFIIAMCGVGIFLIFNIYSIYFKFVALGSFVFTSIWSTDIIPKFIKHNFFEREYVKPFFPILICFYLFYFLMNHKFNSTETSRLA